MTDHIVLIDTDPGIDDAVAIMFALRVGMRVAAITAVSGNLPAARTSVNARKVLELMGERDIPVAQGPPAPLVRPYPKDPFSHGDDGLGNTGLPEPTLPLDPRFAPEVIVDVVNAHPGRATILALGPLTNLALALIRDPGIAGKVENLFLIGGAFGLTEHAYTRATGDNPVSEWNVYVDPEAAQIVFGSGIPITALGLDVVTDPQLALRAEDLARLDASELPEARFLRDVADYGARRGFDSYCALIDSVAVVAALDPSMVKTRAVRVGIETAGTLTRGQTVADVREHFRWEHLPLIQVAVAVDFPRLLTSLVSALTAPRSLT